MSGIASAVPGVVRPLMGMATTSAGPSGMCLLPHQLVARDDRSSYIPRVDTLVGPGEYAIPSIFNTPPVNAQMRALHQCYGREFASNNRVSSMQEVHTMENGNGNEQGESEVSPEEERMDRYVARRERLRELLQSMQEQRTPIHNFDQPPSVMVSPRKQQTLPLSPSLSCTSNYDVFVEGYRHRRDHGKSCSTSSVRSPTSPRELESTRFTAYSSTSHSTTIISPKKQVASAASQAMTPLSYREYLSTTSYNKRLKKVQQRPHSSCGPSSSPRQSSSQHHPHHHTP